MSFSNMLEILKEKNKGKIVIIKLGAFYIATEEDAVFLHKKMNLKCNCFKNNIFKIGFPVNALEKYIEKLNEIIYSNEGKCGLAIGNYTSQMFANIYLNEVDQYIKHKLHCKYYFRYMDDSIILIRTKEGAKQILEKIKKEKVKTLMYNCCKIVKNVI